MNVNQASFRIIGDLLEARTGQRLTEGRRWRIATALSGILRKYRLARIDELVGLMSRSDGAGIADDIVEALLNNETYFFRDGALFNRLRDEVLPGLAQKRGDTKRLSLWSAGCSTGQEAYSLAMLFRENAGFWNGWTIDILGTDVSHRVILKAREAHYSQFEIQRGLGMERMLDHFEQCDGYWLPVPELRDMVRFKTANLLRDDPASHQFDLILCRNVLLYFDVQRRGAAFARIAETLRSDGLLMLGSGEDAAGSNDLFERSENSRLFRKRSYERGDRLAIRRSA